MTPVPITDFLSVMEQLIKLHNRLFGRLAQQFSLSHTEIQLILFLSSHPGRRIAQDIVRLRLLSKASVSRAVESLRKKGYLDCQTSETDRRSVQLTLSPKAQDVLQENRRLQQEMLSALLQDVPAEDYQTMMSVIERMNRNAARLLAVKPFNGV